MCLTMTVIGKGGHAADEIGLYWMAVLHVVLVTPAVDGGDELDDSAL